MKGGIKTGCIFLFTGRWAHKLGGGGGAYNLAGFIMGSLRYGPTNRGADCWNFMAGQPGSYPGKSSESRMSPSNCFLLRIPLI